MEILPRDMQVGWLGLSQRSHDHSHYNSLQLQQLKHRYGSSAHVPATSSFYVENT